MLTSSMPSLEMSVLAACPVTSSSVAASSETESSVWIPACIRVVDCEKTHSDYACLPLVEVLLTRKGY